MHLVPFCRIGDSVCVGAAVLVVWDIGSGGDVVDVGSFGWERIVTWGTKEFQLGQLDVSVRADQTFGDGAVMKVELPM